MTLISWKKQNEIAKRLTANLIILESIYKEGEMNEECYEECYEKCVENTVNVLSEVCTLKMLIKCQNTLERRRKNECRTNV